MFVDIVWEKVRLQSVEEKKHWNPINLLVLNHLFLVYPVDINKTPIHLITMDDVDNVDYW